MSLVQIQHRAPLLFQGRITTPLSPTTMKVEHELPHLVKLLDDDDPSVRKVLKQCFAEYTGDLREELNKQGLKLPADDLFRLSELLAPGRRRQLREQWVVPVHGLDENDGDWDNFELLLRLISELLHDGISTRPTLPDALDQLADEAVLHDAHKDEAALCEFLFGSERLGANTNGFYHPGNADLVWILINRRGNPIGLSVIAMLVAHRLNLRIVGCNFPAHFLAWITVEGEDQLVDCYGRGRLIPIEQIRTNSAVLTNDARRAIAAPCTMRDILLRMLGNLHLAFTQQHQEDDCRLVQELMQSLARA